MTAPLPYDTQHTCIPGPASASSIYQTDWRRVQISTYNILRINGTYTLPTDGVLFPTPNPCSQTCVAVPVGLIELLHVSCLNCTSQQITCFYLNVYTNHTYVLCYVNRSISHTVLVPCVKVLCVFWTRSCKSTHLK